ncbi:hemerythrin domain-containing protein [Kibdelosporangium aridum]|uniref:Hemerythrin domain-containing protein n=1 Tax=Kibdelosporangium aridum TaxID=2030 RepID=A0A428YR85_KIBAR|nr:hemerythrin domain-containing protein [Kibdelosporangium aridum]RSM71488.1 hemerythrin domain-containing protein [Kibdelosporangium aridum]
MPTPDRKRAMAAQLVRAHDDLRRELRRVRSQLGKSDAALSRSLTTHCLAFCDNLRHHHTMEDNAFALFDSDLAPVLDRLRQEHHVVSSALGQIRELLGSDTAAADVELALEQLSEQLERHFAYEEEQLLPVLNG